jgi:hypothetical protein
MTQQYIQVGATPNDGQGTPLRNSFIISNNNFTELYARAQVNPPTSLRGSPGDQPGWYAYSSQYFYYCFAAYDGVNDIWSQLTQSGNVTATQIVNGTSSIKIATANSSATVSIANVANVVVFQAGGANISGYLTVTGNVRGGNILTSGVISSTANITTSGNISGNYILGNGSQLTGLPDTYTNANVAAFLPTYTGNLSPGAIFTDGYFYANGDPFVGNGGGGGGNYTNANVAAFLPTYTGDLAGNNLALTGSATVTGNIDVTGNVNGIVNGQLYGLVNAVNLTYGTWDFGYIVANTYSNPLQWIFAQTSLGNINMGTVIAPASIEIDIGTIF